VGERCVQQQSSSSSTAATPQTIIS
jgi:hypothetical protein